MSNIQTDDLLATGFINSINSGTNLINQSDQNEQPNQNTESENLSEEEQTKRDSERFKREMTKYFNGILQIIIYLLIIVVIVFIHFCLGGLILYQCKLGQSNILPTEINCFPYTNTKPVIDPISTNIFTTSSDPPLSAKLSFPFDNYNSKNFLLDAFRKYNQITPSSFSIINLIYMVYIIITSYIIAIYYGFINFYYYAINIVLNIFNSYLSESSIILLGPFVMPIALLIIGILQNFYFIYLWFINILLLFDFKKQFALFEKLGFKGLFKIIPFVFSRIICWWLVFVFCFLFFFVFFFWLPMLGPLINTIIQFSCLFYKGTIDGEKVSAFKTIKELFNVHKSTLMIIISILIVLMAFSQLGLASGIVSMLLLLLIYYSVIGIDLFKSTCSFNLSELVSDNIANKTCTTIP